MTCDNTAKNEFPIIIDQSYLFRIEEVLQMQIVLLMAKGSMFSAAPLVASAALISIFDEDIRTDTVHVYIWRIALACLLLSTIRPA